MRKTKFIAIIISIILVSVVIIPIAINESYKHGVVYVTKWDAADVLSYYGTLVSASATMMTIIGTILFTRKQIQRDRFLERNQEKWEKVDKVITQALITISPLNLRATGNMDTPNGMIHNRLSALQAYIIAAKTSLDMIKCHTDPDEYKLLGDFINEISEAIEQFCMIAHELELEYMAMQDLAICNGGRIPDAEFSLHLGRTNEIIKRIPPAYDGPYQKLLNIKREVFDKIYTDIEMQANQMLKFGIKRGENSAHT